MRMRIELGGIYCPTSNVEARTIERHAVPAQVVVYKRGGCSFRRRRLERLTLQEWIAAMSARAIST